MAGSTIRWGIVGCGDVTEVKSGPAYQQTDGFSLDAVMRRSADKAADYARRHSVPRWYANAAELINDPGIDAVYIATPPASHCELALAVAAAGKICCVEKPMANSVAECERMNAAFTAAGCPLFVAYYRRSLPRFVQIAKWVASGAIGEVRHVGWRLIKPPSEGDRGSDSAWRTDPAAAPGGYFDDLASHGLDAFDYLLGPIERLGGQAVNQAGLYATVDAVVATWQHPGLVTGCGSWHFGGAVHEEEAVIEGSLGRIRFAVFDDRPIVLDCPDGQDICDLPDPPVVQLPHVQNMARSLREGAAHPSTGESAVRTARAMAAVIGPRRVG